MLKKLLCMLMTLFTTVYTQYDNDELIDGAFQELIYTIGMHLAEQPAIQDVDQAQKILLSMYDQIDTVAQIIDLFLQIDDLAQEQNITTFSQMLDYEKKAHPAMIDAGIVWLQAYQELFKIFIEMHQGDCSFATWCQDAAIILAIEDEQIEDSHYLKLWQAGCKVMLAQYHFEQVIKDLE